MTDRAASVLARLRNQAAASSKPFQLCLQLFCQEEFLRRLAASDYKNNLVLKGGHLIYCLTEFNSRPTVDIDFLAQGTANTIEALEKVLISIINTKTGNDFVSYEVKHIEEISIEKRYPGLSAVLQAQIKNTKTPVKIDFGFGDVVFPKEQVREVPTQLRDFDTPKVKTYSLETVVAEKLDAILDLMEFSSRMKDYYDIYFLSVEFSFDGDRLRTALVNTFKNRERTYKKDDLLKVLAFSQDTEMVRKWDAFLIKMKLPFIQFESAIAGIATFLQPVWDSMYTERSIGLIWNPRDSKWMLTKS
ncbi:MAG TPA: nucleotidyl transferase AbiEii/AbiGii toxin family protein [Paludibacter sp.]|nr:nucleotidyl transferase AbiEii/AbiGii toxin family protein [Paludibacter sp.]